MGICKELLVEWKVGDLDTVKEDMGITSLCLFWKVWKLIPLGEYFTGMSAYHSYFHVGQNHCICPIIDPRWSFSSQILTIPFLWALFPYLKEVFMRRGLSEHYIHQMALCVQNHTNVLPDDISADFPGYACLLGNILETASVFFSQPDCSLDMAIDIAAVMTFLLQALPPMNHQIEKVKKVCLLINILEPFVFSFLYFSMCFPSMRSSITSNSSGGEDEMAVGDEIMEKVVSRDLEQQISNAIDPRFLLQLTNALFGGISLINHLCEEGPDDREVAAIGAACAFLHVTFNILPLERIMTLAYLSGDMPGWQLPLAVFCPVYKSVMGTAGYCSGSEGQTILVLLNGYFVLLGWFPPCLLGLLLGPPFEAKLEWGFGRICLWVVLQHGRSSACQKGKVDSLKEYWLAWGTLVLHLVVEKSHSLRGTIACLLQRLENWASEVDNLVEKGGKGANMEEKGVWASGVSRRSFTVSIEDEELGWGKYSGTVGNSTFGILFLIDHFMIEMKELFSGWYGWFVTIMKMWRAATSPFSVGRRLTRPSEGGHPIEFTQQRVSIVTAELLSQLQDWNNRRQFAPPSYFHADAVNEYFISQAVIENTRAYTILKQAPFWCHLQAELKYLLYADTYLPVTVSSSKAKGWVSFCFTRNRFRIRRDHILEDAFNQLSVLSEDDLRGLIRISFVNEFGVEEAGIDGGGIFKDFMENITRAAFDVQYGLFKETADHLLYPNPGSGMIHEQHLQFFHFLGTVLGKV
ncbi:E3 ubiquitin-protein ligase UPL6 [Vitis vinifera]|uniref:HECT-type E3 ubiquitin transferase n=1 Tax=Vitis vinifera TaxID=29760 RepID=A0A438GHE2_VITVI|nr:E3 ubiquitin-protein ligase UPL6 [Vitis vinifera]